jgi:uncharacterized membrane-anchored protein YhcB (DUF1043 family)
MADLYAAMIVVGVFAGGFVAGYFVMRNNKKYLNVEKIAQAEIDKIKKQFDTMKDAKVKELQAKKEAIKAQVLIKVNEIVKSI